MARTTNTRRVANATADREATRQRMRTGGRAMNPRLPSDNSSTPELNGGRLATRGAGFAKVGPAPSNSPRIRAQQAPGGQNRPKKNTKRGK